MNLISSPNGQRSLLALAELSTSADCPHSRLLVPRAGDGSYR